MRTGVSSKKIKKVATKRNEDLRADFIAQMAQYTPEQLGFLDEVLKDECTAFHKYGCSRKGKRAIMKGVFVCGQWFSAEGLLTLDGMISSTVVEGSMTRALFLEYLEFTVVSGRPHFDIQLLNIDSILQMPLCSPFPGNLSVLVMDNARIHHGAEILELAERFHRFISQFFDRN